MMPDSIQPQKKAVVAAPKLGFGNTLYFYGRVNYWATLEHSKGMPIKTYRNVICRYLKTDITNCKKYGVSGYIIEMGGWRTNSEVVRNKKKNRKCLIKYQQHLETIRTAYNYLHRLCIDNGMWLMVCLVNINALESKLGNKAISASTLFDYGKDLMKIVKEDGASNVLIQPISEYRYVYDRDVSMDGNNVSDYGYLQKCYRNGFKAAYKFHKWVCDEANEMGVKTILNEAPGGPCVCANCDFAAYHPENYKEKLDGFVPRQRCFVVSDNTPLIEWLNGGASVTKTNANCKPARITLWKNRFKNSRIAVLGYYDFKREKPNVTAIKKMGGGTNKKLLK